MPFSGGGGGANVDTKRWSAVSEIVTSCIVSLFVLCPLMEAIKAWLEKQMFTPDEHIKDY